MKRVIVIIPLVLFVFATAPLFTEAPPSSRDSLKLGVLANRPKSLAMEQWRPLAAYLQTALGRPVELVVYDHAGLSAAVRNREVDVVLTSPGHFIHLRKAGGLSAPLATLITQEGSNALSEFGGTIFTSSDRSDITSLDDLARKRIAAVSLEAFGSYQVQAFELLEAHIPLPTGDRLLLTALPQDRVVEAILSGRADAGFIRAGILESMTREGKLDPGRIKIINRQNLPTFPYAVSTRLYPEWPVAVTSQVDGTLAARMAAALFLLPHGSFKDHGAGICGFTIPANYDVVETLLRRLRLPPFDHPPEVRLVDLWRGYAPWIVALAGLVLLVAGSSIGLVILYGRSRQNLHEVERMAEKESLILSSLEEGLYGVDAQGNCIFINPRALSLLGFAEDEVLGKSPHDLFHGRRDDGSPYPVEECPLTLTLCDGKKREVEDAFLRRDGRKIPVFLVVAAMRHDNAIVGAVAVFQDISESKRAEAELRDSEERLRLTLEATGIGIWDWDVKNDRWYASPIYYILLGYQPKYAEENRSEWMERVYPEDRTKVAEKIQAVLSRDFVDFQYDARMLHANGAFRWQHVHGFAIKRDEAGYVTRMLGIQMDIHDRQIAEEEVRRLNEQLEQRVRERTAELQAANRELETFTYSVSHDLRQPLRAIDGFLGLLKKRIGTSLDDEARRYISVISESALRMSSLIDDLLSFSRSGRFEMNMASVDLGILAQEVIRELAADLQNRAIEWRIADLPVVTGDRAMLRVAMANLISNALKFTQQRERSEIEIGCMPGQKDEVVVFVRDNGVGFDMKYASKLFGVFQRLHGVDEFKGTGIGLANVRRIISRHGGRTWAEGKLDGGATFYFSLPDSRRTQPQA